MAPQIKLTYFAIQALGEPARYLLAYGNLPYVDNRVQKDEWTPQAKAAKPFGRMPTLEIDGVTLHQHTAIARYLARKLNLTGKDDLEAAQIDQLVDTFSDLRVPLADYYYDANPQTKAPKLVPIQEETIPYYFNKFEAILAKNGGHYLVGKQLTWADLYLASIWEYLKSMSEVDLDTEYPTLGAVVDKVNELPQIKAWLAKRPADSF